MNKLKTVFQRSSQKANEDNRRPQQFLKRHSSITTKRQVEPNQSHLPPTIDLSDLSQAEKEAYEAWWRDLDPFDLQKINNQTILKFLNGCSLSDDRLEQILVLFKSAGDGLDKFQFFAMLRLIAHAQNGRKISQALVYLGAPVPHFHTNAIDALIKSDTMPKRQLSCHSSSSSSSNSIADYNEPPSRRTNNRSSWWGHEKQAQLENRRSYMGPFTAHTPVPDNNNNTPMPDYFYPLPPIQPNTNTTSSTTIATTTTFTPNAFSPIIHSQPSWSADQQLSIDTSMVYPSATATITPVTPNIIQVEEKPTHGRSKSAGNVADFYHNPYHQTIVDNQLHSSQSSLSIHELNTGQTLLLTQKFVYQSPSLRHKELQNTNNPFNIVDEPLMSPFGDENTSDDSSNSSGIDERANRKPNRHSMPPPPVPDQATKPAFPKYARTNTFMVRRSQSTSNDRKEAYLYKHQRHKSTSATPNISF